MDASYGDTERTVERLAKLEATVSAIEQKPAPVLVPVINALNEIKAAIIATASNSEASQLLRAILAVVDDLGTKENQIMSLVESIAAKQAEASAKADVLLQSIAALKAQVAAGTPATVEQLQAILDAETELANKLGGATPATPAD